PYQPRSGRDAEKLQSDDDLWPCRPRRGAPIDRFQKHGQLRHGQRDKPLLGLRPDETTTIQLLRVQAHALTIPEQNLHQVTSTTAKNVERAAVGIVLQCRLHLRRERVEALPHVGDPAGQIDPDLTGGQHQCPSSAASTPRRTFRSTPWPTRTRAPLGMSISITPSGPDARRGCAAGTLAESALTCTGKKFTPALAIAWRRQV